LKTLVIMLVVKMKRQSKLGGSVMNVAQLDRCFGDADEEDKSVLSSYLRMSHEKIACFRKFSQAVLKKGGFSHNLVADMNRLFHIPQGAISLEQIENCVVNSQLGSFSN